MPGVEQVRLVSSGTEATMSALRLARGATGRDKIVKFAGCYHGHSDALLAAGGSRGGQPGPVRLGRRARRRGGRHRRRALQRGARPSTTRWPCVVVEPVAANMGLVPPGGRLPRRPARTPATGVGALLLFDEVITGFRLVPAAAPRRGSACAPTCGASARSSAAACRSARSAARAAVMAQLAPLGPVYQAGHAVGEPAGHRRRPRLPGRARPRRLRAARRHRRPPRRRPAPGDRRCRLAVQVPRVGPLVGIFFTDRPVRDFDDARDAGRERPLPARSSTPCCARASRWRPAPTR